MSADDLFVRSVRVETWKDDARLTNASGFFYLHDQCLYLITNHHVVSNESVGHQPDSLRLLLHTDSTNLTLHETLTVPLYQDGSPVWREHPVHGAEVDVVAVGISDPTVLRTHYLKAFQATDVLNAVQTLPPGQSVLIVGFPLGFHDTLHNLPLIRQAVVASDFSHPFKGQPYFLTDARMHRGTSGAPVVARIKCAALVVGQFEEQWCLLGIHSAALDVSDRDPTQDDRLGLNCTWYASLISEIVSPADLQSHTGVLIA